MDLSADFTEPLQILTAGDLWNGEQADHTTNRGSGPTSSSTIFNISGGSESSMLVIWWWVSNNQSQLKLRWQEFFWRSGRQETANNIDMSIKLTKNKQKGGIHLACPKAFYLLKWNLALNSGCQSSLSCYWMHIQFLPRFTSKILRSSSLLGHHDAACHVQAGVSNGLISR